MGQYVTSTVEAVKNEGRVVRLSVSQLNSSQACIRSTQGWNLTNLLPGLLVNTTIKKVKKNNLYFRNALHSSLIQSFMFA